MRGSDRAIRRPRSGVEDGCEWSDPANVEPVEWRNEGVTVDELEDRVRQAALDATSTVDPALSRREAARAERDARREAKHSEARRTASLKGIVRRLRAALKDRGDVGTAGFRRHRVSTVFRFLRFNLRGYRLYRRFSGSIANCGGATRRRFGHRE